MLAYISKFVKYFKFAVRYLPFVCTLVVDAVCRIQAGARFYKVKAWEWRSVASHRRIYALPRRSIFAFCASRHKYVLYFPTFPLEKSKMRTIGTHSSLLICITLP